jgi:CDGSH-type Zn-finger protein
LEAVLTEPVVTQKKPFIIEEKARKVAWCSCGKSANQPYCDGSHKECGMSPIVVELTEDKKVAWCGCRHSKNLPYCDGSHKDCP